VQAVVLAILGGIQLKTVLQASGHLLVLMKPQALQL
jgi:hypothetical protein